MSGGDGLVGSLRDGRSRHVELDALVGVEFELTIHLLPVFGLRGMLGVAPV